MDELQEKFERIKLAILEDQEQIEEKEISYFQKDQKAQTFKKVLVKPLLSLFEPLLIFTEVFTRYSFLLLKSLFTSKWLYIGAGLYFVLRYYGIDIFAWCTFLKKD